MTPSRAKEVLEGMELGIFTDKCLYRLSPFLSVSHKSMINGGSVTTEELEAITMWMRDPEGVTNA